MIKEEILKLIVDKNNNINSTKLIKFNKSNESNFTPESIYLLFNTRSLCKECNNETRFINYKKGYLKFCSKSCSAQSEEAKEKMKSTCLERYGVEYASQSEEIKEKSKKTCLEKYGVEHIMLDEIIKSKKMNSTKQNNTLKYGFESTLSVQKIREKIKNTLKLKYNTEIIWEIPGVKDKIKSTMLERYGVEHPMFNIEVKEKIKNTCLERYGVEYASQSHILNFKDLNIDFLLEKFTQNNKFLIEDATKYFNVSEQMFHPSRSKFNLPPNKHNKHKTQQEIYSWIKSITNEEVLFNDRKIISPKELDIVIPSKKLAIEYNGLMFHSFGKSKYSMFNNSHLEEKQKYNHLRKTQEAEENGYCLLHIFENEWLNPKMREEWKSIIKDKLNNIINIKLDNEIILDRRIYSRKDKEYLETIGYNSITTEINSFNFNNRRVYDCGYYILKTSF